MHITQRFNGITSQAIVDGLSIGELTNTDESTFWYVSTEENKFARRYKHEEGKAGDIFRDGNNGDRWKVIAINTDYKRAIVTNLSQSGSKLVFWNTH